MKLPHPHLHLHWRHIGMRIIKTVVAVYLCGLFAWFRGESAFFSMIAAMACIQNTTTETIKSSVDRMIGTLIGGVAGVITVHAMNDLGVIHLDLLRYLVVALLLIPIIEISLMVKKPGCASMACMVFMCLVVDPGDKPAIYSIQRLFETFVGAALACGINILLPYKAPQQQAERQIPAPAAKPAKNKNQRKSRKKGKRKRKGNP